MPQQHPKYYKRLTAALGQYQHVYIVELLNHSLSKRELGRLRAAFHGRAEFLVGECYLMLQCITQYCAENPHDHRW